MPAEVVLWCLGGQGSPTLQAALSRGAEPQSQAAVLPGVPCGVRTNSPHRTVYPMARRKKRVALSFSSSPESLSRTFYGYFFFLC